MARPVQQFVDYFAAEPIRVSAILRLPLIGLIAVLVWIWEVDHWLPGLHAVILGVYAVAALVWLMAVLKGPVPRWGDWAFPRHRHSHCAHFIEVHSGAGSGYRLCRDRATNRRSFIHIVNYQSWLARRPAIRCHRSRCRRAVRLGSHSAVR